MENQSKQHKKIYLLPNLLTTSALFAGFYAIVASTQGHYKVAAVAVFIAMIMDGLDGRIARLTNSSSDFGAQYDSIADMVSFGLAPALIMYEWSLSLMGQQLGWYWSKLGWLAAFVYVAGAALRLARFNAMLATADKKVFQGLASPAAAAVMVGLVWLADDLGYNGDQPQLMLLSFVTTLMCGLLMVSNFSYYSFKDISLKSGVPFKAILVTVLVFVCISLDPPKVLFAFFFVYMLSGPITALMRKLRKRTVKADDNVEEESPKL